MQDRESPSTSSHEGSTGIAEPKRRLRSLVLAWHDEETGDELTIDVTGSEKFLEGLAPLGFRTVERPVELEGAGEPGTPRTQILNTKGSNTNGTPRSPAERGRSPAPERTAVRKEREATEHRVRWTVRLARLWKPKGR